MTSLSLAGSSNPLCASPFLILLPISLCNTRIRKPLQSPGGSKRSRGAKVQDLHNTWSFGHGLFPILRSGRSFNLVALVGLTVTLAPINGPLLQRASILHERTHVEMVNFTISTAQEFPDGYTGNNSGHGDESPGTFSVSFHIITKQYNNRSPMSVTNSGCSGSCKGTLLGASYQMKCHQYTTSPYTMVVGLEIMRSKKQRCALSSSTTTLFAIQMPW